MGRGGGVLVQWENLNLFLVAINSRDFVYSEVKIKAFHAQTVKLERNRV
jgi:hypothetical protein